jgi:hypothetical protein
VKCVDPVSGLLEAVFGEKSDGERKLTGSLARLGNYSRRQRSILFPNPTYIVPLFSSHPLRVRLTL